MALKVEGFVHSYIEVATDRLKKAVDIENEVLIRSIDDENSYEKLLSSATERELEDMRLNIKGAITMLEGVVLPFLEEINYD